MTRELYLGQSEIVAGKLAADELRYQANEERLKTLTDPTESEALLRLMAGQAEGLAHRRQFLAKLQGDGEEAAPRDRVVRLRLTEAEHAAVQQAAEEAGLSVSAYIRGKLQ